MMSLLFPYWYPALFADKPQVKEKTIQTLRLGKVVNLRLGDRLDPCIKSLRTLSDYIRKDESGFQKH